MTNTTPTIPPSPRSDVSLLSEQDLYLFNEGRHYRAYEKLGAHLTKSGDEPGAASASGRRMPAKCTVIGSFNGWDPTVASSAGPRELGHLGRFHPRRQQGIAVQVSHRFASSRPRGRQSRSVRAVARKTAAHCLRGVGSGLSLGRSRVDGKSGEAKNSLQAPISIYEVHLGSWMRVPEEHNRPLTYRETCAAPGRVCPPHAVSRTSNSCP